MELGARTCSLYVPSIIDSFFKARPVQLYRYFLSLPLPLDARNQGDARQKTLGLKYAAVSADHLHMTVAVIDMARPDQCPDRKQQIETALAGEKLPDLFVRLDRREDGMLVGSNGVPGFQRLQDLVLQALSRKGIVAESRPARPHVSLCFDPEARGRHLIEPIEWRAQEMELIESHLGQTRHVPLASWHLGPGPCDVSEGSDPPRQLALL